MEPLFLTYLAVPLGYAGLMVGVSSVGTALLDRGKVRQAIKLFKLGARAPFLGTHNLISRSNLMAAYHALEDYQAVEEQWRFLEPRLPRLAPYSGLPAASYCASLVCQGHYREALEVVSRPEAQTSDPQQVDNRAASICESLRLVNQAACHLLLGETDRAADLMDRAQAITLNHPMLEVHRATMRARLLYQTGQQIEAGRLAASVDLSRLPPLYREEMGLHRATLLARCGRVEAAARAVEAVPECLNTRRIRMIRVVARAALAEARGEARNSLSYARDVVASGLPAGEATLRAGNLARAQGDLEQADAFYRAAVSSDPESCWARLAARRLTPEPRSPMS